MMSKFGPEMNDVNNMAPLDFESIKEQMQKGTVSLNSAGLLFLRQDCRGRTDELLPASSCLGSLPSAQPC